MGRVLSFSTRVEKNSRLVVYEYVFWGMYFLLLEKEDAISRTKLDEHHKETSRTQTTHTSLFLSASGSQFSIVPPRFVRHAIEASPTMATVRELRATFLR